MVAVVVGLVAACSGGIQTRPSTGSSATSSAPAARIPDDGLALVAFGYLNGPVSAFSLPRTTVLQAAVDQPNNVSVVISRPSATDVYAYLVRTLPTAGFTITDRDDTSATLTFSGLGWTGSFTGNTRTCAVLLRPA